MDALLGWSGLIRDGTSPFRRLGIKKSDDDNDDGALSSSKGRAVVRGAAHGVVAWLCER